MTENPYAMGPPPEYHPPPAEELTDPEVHRSAADRGRAKCLAALQEAGITRDERGKWNVETTTKEKNR